MHARGAVDRFLLDGLSRRAEARMRDHLRGCDGCQAYYDEQVSLLRALAGAPDRPTRAELARLAHIDEDVRATAPSLWQRLASVLAFHPLRTALGACAVVLLIVAATVGGRLVHTTRVATAATPDSVEHLAPVPAATIVRATAATLDGLPVKEGTSVPSMAVLVVAEGGLVEAELVRGGTLRVFPSTTLSLLPRGEQVVLAHGKVWCIVDTGKGPFLVTTPQGAAEVLGTSFIVDASADDATDVRVVEGKVAVTDAEDRGTVVVRAAETSRLTADARPTPARRGSGTDAAEWQRAFDRFFKDLGRGIQRGIDSLQRSISGGR